MRYLNGQDYFGNAAAVVLMTAVFARTQWKYPGSRAYRVVLIDAGHLCQTFCLAATWLGLAPFCTMALQRSQVEKDLGIDGVRESAIYAAGVGVPQEGVEWAPWPDLRRYGSRRPNSEWLTSRLAPSGLPRLRKALRCKRRGILTCGEIGWSVMDL